MAFNISTGFDNVPGAGQIVVQPNATHFQERPDSPNIELAEQGMFTHVFDCDWATAQSLILFRGTYLRDTPGNLFRVLTCGLQHGRGNIGTLTITSESVSFNPPPDEYDDEPVEFNPALEKHPRYAALTDLDRQNIHAALDLPQELARTEAAVAGNTYDPAAQPALYNLFNELLSKLRKGEETYYLDGIKITWSTFSYAPQIIDRGGYVQSPTMLLPLAFYMNGGVNTLPANWSWLRQADHRQFVRTWFKHTRSWIGAPNGHWDTQIYS